MVQAAPPSAEGGRGIVMKADGRPGPLVASISSASERRVRG